MTPTELRAAAGYAKIGAEFDLDMLRDEPDSATADDYSHARAVLAIADYVLATVLADDGGLVTADWLDTLPHKKRTMHHSGTLYGFAVVYPLMLIVDLTASGISVSLGTARTQAVLQIKTRSQFRAFCRAGRAVGGSEGGGGEVNSPKLTTKHLIHHGFVYGQLNAKPQLCLSLGRIADGVWGEIDRIWCYHELMGMADDDPWQFMGVRGLNLVTVCTEYDLETVFRYLTLLGYTLPPKRCPCCEKPGELLEITRVSLTDPVVKITQEPCLICGGTNEVPR